MSEMDAVVGANRYDVSGLLVLAGYGSSVTVQFQLRSSLELFSVVHTV